MKHCFPILAIASCLLCSVLQAADAGTEGPVRTKVFLSDTFLINKLYRSMEGPLQVKKFKLDPSKSELLWIKKISVQVVGQDGFTPSHQDFFCHFNVDFDVPGRRNLLPTATVPSHRLLTMSQGQMEIWFPESTALPIHSQEELTFYFQILNRIHAGTFYVKHRVTVEYIEDKQLNLPMLPLFAHSGMVIQTTKAGVGTWNEPAEKKSCGCCRSLSVGDRYPTGMGYIKDSLGNLFASHWKVPPGKQESATPLHSFMPLPYKTTVHGFSPHVHPYAESLWVVDTRTEEKIIKAEAETSKSAPVLEKIQYLSFPVSSALAVDETPSYEMVVAYDNPTGEDQDAMAMAVFYLHDKTFKAGKAMNADILALHRQQHAPDMVGCSLIPCNVPSSDARLLPGMEINAAQAP